jgi:molecular chaperone DnaK
MSANDAAAMNRAMEQLTQAQHKAAEALYKQAGTGGGAPGEGATPGADAGPGAGAPGGGAHGDVIDAEVVEEDKK